VLFGQGPPTVRITHLTASVLYQRPTSQGVPERERKEPEKKGKKKKWGFFGGGRSTGRRNVRVLQPGIFPITPPGFFEGQWPSHKPPPTFRVSFERRLLTPLELNEYPPTPPPISVVAETPALKATLIEFERQLQKLPQLDEFPTTPIPPAIIVSPLPQRNWRHSGRFF
jgi:hypothetical protein